MKSYALLLMLLCTFGICTATAQKFSDTTSAPLRVYPYLKIWKTVDIGCYKDDSDLRDMITDTKIPINGIMDSILNQSRIVTTPVQGKARLVKILVSKLSPNAEPTYKELCYEAMKCGLTTCSPEVIVRLRLDYKDQPKPEWLWIMTDPIKYSWGGIENEALLALVNTGIWENSIYAGGGRFQQQPFSPDQEVVFQLGR